MNSQFLSTSFGASSFINQRLHSFTNALIVMKVSTTAFVTLAIASVSLAIPTEKRHGPGKRGLVWPFYNSGLDPGRLNDGQGTVNLMCVLTEPLPLVTFTF